MAASSGARSGPSACAQSCKAATSRVWKRSEEWCLRYQHPLEALVSRHTAELSRSQEQSVTSVISPATWRASAANGPGNPGTAPNPPRIPAATGRDTRK